MKTMRNCFLILTALVLAAANVFAQEKAGISSMQFLKVMPCARATALGDAYVAVASGAEALFWNPAGLAWTDKQELSLTYIDWIFDAKLYDLAYAIPLGNFGNVGLQVQFVDYGDFDETVAHGLTVYPGQVEPFLTGKTFKPYNYVIGLSYAKKMTEKFSFGLTAKYAYESLYDEKQIVVHSTDGDGNIVNSYAVDAKRGAFLIDAGIRYNTGFRNIQIGVSAQNFGPNVKYKSDTLEHTYPAPLSFRLGVAADLIGPNSLLLNIPDHRLGIVFDLFLANDGPQQEHLGIEYEFANTFALRAGYKINYVTEGLVLGGGVRQRVGNMDLTLDYSYGALNEMISDFTGNAHRITLGVGIQ
ncbi:MAG: PorV/PorQ family protein [Ignavibacteriae bacterium]|nr:MAG: PorV/PorQ family protein [Ignavibacteriota bacterium]